MAFPRFLVRGRFHGRVIKLLAYFTIFGVLLFHIKKELKKDKLLNSHILRNTGENVSVIVGQVNVDIWRKICSINFNSLRQFPLYPLFPHERNYFDVQDSITYNLKDKYIALRIMGYLHPPQTGHYSFHLSSATMAELWLGTSAANNTVIAYTTHNAVGTLKFDLSAPKPISEGIFMDNSIKYYFEILVAVNEPFKNSAGKVELSWKLPDSHFFTKITGSHVTKYFDLPSAYRTSRNQIDDLVPSLEYSEIEDLNTAKIFALDKNRTIKSKEPAFTLRQDNVKELLGNLLDIKGSEYNRDTARKLPYMEHTGNDVIGSFPKCIYDPAYTKNRTVKRYNGVWQVDFPDIFPSDGTDLARFRRLGSTLNHERGNKVMNGEDVISVVKVFMDALERKQPRKYTLNSILNVEKFHPKKLKGDRFLMELVLRRRDNDKLYRISEYFYRESNQTSLCFLQNLRWNPKVWVNVILNVKNQAGWVLSFVKEMARILKETRDEYVNFVIADYGNEGIDVTQEMMRHGIKTFSVFNQTGPFFKTSTINSAASKVKDPNSIVLLMDLHLKFPSTLFDYVRKHTFQGKTAFTPILMRLTLCGRPKTKHLYSHGFYEPSGFGLFGIYKSDWDKFGGMNEKEFKNKWGGEDWEMVDRVLIKGYEVDKLRIPGFYHFDHDKTGMWN